MALTDKLTAVADAIRGKTGKTEPLTLDQMPGEIAGIVAGGSDDGFTLKMKTVRNNSLLQGQFEGVKNLEVDVTNTSYSIPAISYFWPSKKGGNCTIKNISTHNMPTDMFRQGSPFSEISFEPYIAPTTMTRFLYQTQYYGYPQNITVRGLRLDNLTGASGAFDQWDGETTFNVMWEGTLNNSISFGAATGLTDESLALIIGCLADYSEGETHTLTLGSTLLGRLTDEQITAATEKGWTLA